VARHGRSAFVAREDVTTKAERLVASGCVHLLVDRPDRVVAKVEGDHGVYAVQGPPDDLACECTAGRTHRRCSHRLAVESLLL